MKLDRNSALVGLIIGILLASVGWMAVGTDPDPALQETALQETATQETASTTTLVEVPVQQQVSDLPPITRGEMPVEAGDTIDLILDGGPYPFDRDDGIFQNREELLPDRPQGHYREYTVITPGSSDRGARRIVAGEDGEMYYTDDHYSSFFEVVS